MIHDPYEYEGRARLVFYLATLALAILVGLLIHHPGATLLGAAFGGLWVFVP